MNSNNQPDGERKPLVRIVPFIAGVLCIALFAASLVMAAVNPAGTVPLLPPDMVAAESAAPQSPISASYGLQLPETAAVSDSEDDDNAPIEHKAEHGMSPVTAPVTEPVIESVTESETEPATEPVTEPITEPVTEPVTEPPIEPFVENDRVIIPEYIPGTYMKCGSLTKAQQDIAIKIAKRFDINVNLLYAMMYVESSFNPRAVSAGGQSYGVMQINKINFESLKKALGVSDFFDYEQNLLCGAYVISGYVHKYENYGKSLMCYYYGAGLARSMWERGIYDCKYVEKTQKAVNYLTSLYE